MISVNEAKSLIARHLHPGPARYVGLLDAFGSILYEPVSAQIDVPSFDNAAMDGYAFAYHPDITAWKVVGKIQAGDAGDQHLREGEAMRIFTGSPVPHGADTVIPQEFVTVAEDIIRFEKNSIQPFANVRKRGAQCNQGDRIATKGQTVTPGMIALLASAGITGVYIYAPPRVAILTTGNELIPMGQPLRPGEIYNTNAPALRVSLASIGITSVSSFHVKDEATVLQENIHASLREYDVLILTGGISVGEYDLVEKCLQAEHVTPLFYKVSQRPGKPLWVGKKDERWVFALPGNPASVITCFNQYVKPVLLGWMGHKDTFAPAAMLTLEHGFVKKNKLTHILKAVRTDDHVRILSGQDSFNLLPFAEANGFVVLDESCESLAEGDLVPFFAL